MNRQEIDILNVLYAKGNADLEELIEASGHCGLVVGKAVASLISQGYLVKVAGRDGSDAGKQQIKEYAEIEADGQQEKKHAEINAVGQQEKKHVEIGAGDQQVKKHAEINADGQQVKTYAEIGAGDRQVKKHVEIGAGDQQVKKHAEIKTEEKQAEILALTPLAMQAFQERSPQNAIILAAGFGMRMVPINLTAPKGMLEVAGEPLVERLIKQLQEVQIRDITIVVGFMKEQFSYLADKYGVTLVENDAFAQKNNLHSLALVADRISNTYIVPSDIWCDANPFRNQELASWYMVSDLIDEDSAVKINRSLELVEASKDSGGNSMIGISYILEEDAVLIRKRIKFLSQFEKHDGQFWEMALYDHGKMLLPARVVRCTDVVEINTYEQLRELDGASNHLKSDALDVIAQTFHTTTDNIVDISVLKKGMTNRSFLFSVNGEKYIMRIPGEGTDQLISRENEARVYEAISGKGLCDDPVYINPGNGYKITKYLEGIRVADAENVPDLKRCMEKLRAFHGMKLQVPHSFDVFGQISYYESLWEGQPSVYPDYEKVRDDIFSLRPFVEAQPKDWVLTHIDAVPDNFLFYKQDGNEQLQLTDWEYAGMQDPHVDIAMFCIYSYYNKREIDRLIRLYFEGEPPRAVRAKIYIYIAACGLLWSNWSEYKRWLSVDFSEYSRRQYKYAKDFYRYARREMEAMEKETLWT